MKIKIVIVLGSTAVGKSELALELAQSVDGGRSFVNYNIDVPPFTCDPGVFFGDYSGISAYNGHVVPIFMHFGADKKLAVSVALYRFRPGTQVSID